MLTIACSGKTYNTFFQPFDLNFGGNNTNVKPNTPGAPAAANPSVPASLLAATPITNTRVMLTFSKPVSLATAQTLTNYSIRDSNNNLISILAATRDATNTSVVFLDTIPQTVGETYTVTAVNIIGVDGASLGSSNSATFVGPNTADMTGPLFSSVSSVNATSVEVYFNEAVSQTNPTTGIDYTNPAFGAFFDIYTNAGCSTGNLNVTSAVRDSTNFAKVTLTNVAMTAGTTYYVCATNSIRDLWGNNNTGTIASAAFVYVAPAPKVLSAVFGGTTPNATLLVTYDLPMTNNAALKVQASYVRSGCTGGALAIPAGTATFISPDKVLITGLTVAAGVGQCLLTVSTAGITSTAGATLAGAPNNQTTFAYNSTDTLPPAVLSIVPTNANTLVVTFNEPVNGGTVNNSSFTFSPSLNVTGVVCTGNTCTLTTDDQTTTSYTATPNGVQDTTGNTIGSGTTTFTGDGKPYIVAVYPVDSGTVMVEWSEPIGNAASVGPTDYSVSGTTITAAALHPNGADPSRYVKLTISPTLTPGTSYTVSVNNPTGSTDASGNPTLATIPGGGTFTGPAATAAPQVVSASSPSSSTVLVNFNEPLNNATIAPGDFAFSGTLCLMTATGATQVAAGVIQVTFTALGSNTLNCTVTVNAGLVADLAGNTILGTNNTADFLYTGTGSADNTKPTVIAVTALNNTQVRVFFSEPIVTGGSFNAGDRALNYTFSPVLAGGISSVSCLTPFTFCTLTLNAPGMNAQVYALSVENVNDIATNTMDPQTINFSGIGSSVTQPTLYLASLINATTLELSFSEAMDLTSSQNVANYAITGGLAVSNPTRQADPTKVRITLGPAPGAVGSGNSYTITATGLTDIATPPNTIGTPNSAVFTGSANAPATTDLADASDLGQSNTDNITSTSAIPGMTFTGTVAPFTVVNLYDDGVLVATAVSNASGVYSVVLNSAATLTVGTNNFTIATVSSTGQLSDQSTPVSITWDATAPAVGNPIGVTTTVATPNGSYGPGSVIAITITFNDTVYVDTTGGTPFLRLMTGSPATTDVSYTSGTGTSTLTFSYTVAAGNNNGDLDYQSNASLQLNSGTIKDAAGNNATLTLANPGAAGSLGSNKDLNIVAVASGAITYDQSGNTTGPFKAGSVTITATYAIDPGATPTIAIDLFGAATGNLSPTPMSGGPLVFTYTYVVNTAGGGVYADGNTTISLNAAGNTNTSNNVFVIDTAAPLQPNAPDLAAADDSGVSNTDNNTNQTTALTFSGTVEANAVVNLYDNAVLVGTTTASALGAYSIDVSLAAGSHPMTVTATDAAGNASIASTGLTVTVNTSPAGTPGTAIDLAAADDTGALTNDNITKNTTGLTFSGTVGAGETVRIYNGAALVTTITANGVGAFSTDLSLVEGTHSITYTTGGVFGNESAASPALSVVVDTTVPANPTLGPDLAAADDSGTSSTDNITNLSSNLTFTGTVEANATVTFFDGAANVGTISADGAGAYSRDLALAAGSHNMTVTATDLAGNVSVGASPVTAVTVDQTLPIISAVSPTANFSNTTVGYTLSEVCASGSITWTNSGGVADGGSPHARALAGAELNAGAFSGTITNNPTLVDGSIYNIAWNCTDLAGNAAATVTSLNRLYSPGVLAVSSAETMDADNDGKIDTYRITFNKPVSDVTFPGHAGHNALGAVTTEWLVAGYTNVRIVTGTLVPGGSDTANDAVIYIRFDENVLTCSSASQVGCDTEAKPDFTSSANAARGLADLVSNLIAQVITTSVVEQDSARPVLIAAVSLGVTSVNAIFSEVVELVTAQTASNYTIDNGITVSTATRNITNQNIVNLVTSTQTGGATYVLTVNTNVKDLANFNMNASANTATFQGVTKPVVVSIATTSATTMTITYNESVTAATTECANLSACAAIYTNVSLPVISAVSTGGAGINAATYTLTVNPMIEGQAYTTTVTQDTVTSVATGQKMGNTNNSATFNGDGKPAAFISTDTATQCPTPTNLPPSAPAARRIVVQYDQTVLTGGGANAADRPQNYAITACVDSAHPCGSGNPQANASVVTSMGGNKFAIDWGANFDTDQSQYELTITNVRDTTTNTVATPTKMNFRCGTDSTPPSLVGISVVSATAGSTVLLLTFSEAVDNVTANAAGNYKFDTNAYGFNVNSAARQSNQAQVQVTFVPAVSNGGHQLLVQNVTDLSANGILTNGINNAQPFIVNAPTGLSGGPVFDDPFADGTPAGQMVIYDNKIVLGWDGNSSKFFEMDKGLTTAQTITLDADGNASAPYAQFSGYASGSSGTLSGLDAINAGCVGGSSTPLMTGTACSGAGGTEYIFAGAFNTGGNYQSVFRTTDKSSSQPRFTFTERGGLTSSGNTYRSMTAAVFRNYLFVASPHRGSNAPRVSRICALPSGSCGNGDTAWNTPTDINGYFMSYLGKSGNIPNSTTNSSPQGNTVSIDTMWEYDNDATGTNVSQLYVANGGRMFDTLGNARTATTRSDGGVLRSRLARSTAAAPPGCTGGDASTANCNANVWEDITPSLADWRNYVSTPLPYLPLTGTDWEAMLPSNRIIPAIKAVPYMRTAPNGDLYMVRNACATVIMQTVCMNGGACNGGNGAATANGFTVAQSVNNNFTADFASTATGRRQVCPPGYEVPQLWVLPKNPVSGGTNRGSGDWVLVASRTFTPQTYPNGSALPSRKGTSISGNTATCGVAPANKCERNSHLTLLEFVGNYLYLGYDNQDHGANIWRVDMNSATCTGAASCAVSGNYPAEASFTIVNSVLGLDGSATNQRIFSHITVNDAGKDWLILATRDGTNSMKIYRTANDQN